MDRIPINRFPYTSYHEINLDWVIERIQEMYTIIDTKISEAVNPIIADLNALTARVDNNDDLIAALTTRITTAENSITGIELEIDAIGGRIDTIENNIRDLTDEVEDLDITISSINRTVNTHTTEIADIYDRISGLDPTGSLYVDATNFNIVARSVSRLEDILQFDLTGGSTYEPIYMQPDLIPGTEAGYYPRVTMTFNTQTYKAELPTELTTGDYPLILRGTYATNVNVDGEMLVNDPLEYNIEGKNFNIEGRDQYAIILMCLWSMHHNSNGYENEIDQTSGHTFVSMPFDNLGSITRWYMNTSALYNLNLWVYFFNKSGDLLDRIDITNYTAQIDSFAVPANTYSIWLGFYAPQYLGRENINQISLAYDGYAGAYKVTNRGIVTEHVVKFESVDDTLYYTASYEGIKVLGPQEKIDMFTGDVYINNHYEYTFNINESFNDLDPETQYTPSLPFDNGYMAANIKYNKVSLLINGLDANNVRY